MGRAASACVLGVWLMVAAALAACDGRPAEWPAAESPTAATPAGAKATTTADAGPTSLAGRYVREEPAVAEMTISPAPGGRWRISVSGSSDKEGPSGPPGDCETVAVGTYASGRMTGELVPFSGVNIEMTPEDVKAKPGQMVLSIAGDRVTVERSDGDQYCGVGSDLTGRYVRSGKTIDQLLHERAAKAPPEPEPSDEKRAAPSAAK